MADIIQHNTDNNRPVSGTTVVPDDVPPNENTTKRKSAMNFDGLQINIGYFRTIPGILKIVEWFIGTICIACASPPYLGAAHWFVFVAVLCYILTFVWICIHFFSITSVISIPWLFIEIGYTAMATVFYFIAFIVLLVETTKYHYLDFGYGYYARDYHFNYNAYLAAGSFGVFNFIAYAAETLYHAKTLLDSRKTTS